MVSTTHLCLFGGWLVVDYNMSSVLSYVSKWVYPMLNRWKMLCTRWIWGYPISGQTESYGGFLKWRYPQIIHLKGFSLINHPFWGNPIYGNPHIVSPFLWIQVGCLAKAQKMRVLQSVCEATSCWINVAQRDETCKYIWYMGISWTGGAPKSPMSMGCSLINHPFWGTTIYGNPHMFGYSRGYSNGVWEASGISEIIIKQSRRFHVTNQKNKRPFNGDTMGVYQSNQIIPIYEK